MRLLPKVFLVVLLLFSLFVPALLSAQELPAILEKDIFPGTTYVDYAGQRFRFTTTIPMHLTLIPRGPYLLEMKVQVRPYRGLAGSSASGEDLVQIFWEEWQADLYDGPPPDGVWDCLMDTESGFTEK